MALTAFRAGEQMDADKLRAHISLLLRVENIGSLFGSGASVTAGGKSMASIWDDFKKNNPESYAFLQSKNLITEGADGKALSNFETTASKIDVALEYLETIQIDTSQAQEFIKAKIDLQKSILKSVKLADDFWLGNFEEDDILGYPTISDYKKFLIRFCANRQPAQPNPWLFTLNYDLGVEWAAEILGINVNNGFKGVHFRKFDAASFDLGQRNTLSTGQAQYSVHGINYVKLHGSLSWKLDKDLNLTEVSSQISKDDIDHFLSGKSSDFPFEMILPNSAKFSKTVGYIYGEMIRRFHEFIAKEQVALFISGYSFGDEHINRILASALENPTLQLVAFYPEFDGDVSSLANAPLLKLAFDNQFPNVTIVGGGNAVYFSKVAELLPLPAIYDERRAELKALIRALGTEKEISSSVKPNAESPLLNLDSDLDEEF